MELLILGLIVLSVYLCHSPAGETRRVDERCALSGLSATGRALSTGGTRAGAFPTRRPSASTTMGRRFAWAWRRRSPVNPTRFPRTRVVARFRIGDPVSAGAGAGKPPGAAPGPQGNPACQARRSRVRPRLRRPGQRSGNGSRLPVTAAREAIANLQRGVHAGGMLVSINPERMLVQIDRNLGLNTDALSWAVQKALVLHDGLIEGVSRRVTQGIAIVDQPDAPDEDDGPPICKVCGEPIAAGEVIVCSVCNTPHHRDCWEYVGACSIYGCNGKVGVVG